MPGLNLALLIPAIYLAVALHELGHLTAGQLVGMPPGGIVIGGFMWLKSGDRWIFRFDYRRILGGGVARPLPPLGEFRPARYAWMVAGGPIASVVLTLVCGVAFLLSGNGAWDWVGTVFWAGVVTVLSLVPYSIGITQTDGAWLRELLTQPQRSRAWMAMLILTGQDANGVRPRDWDAALVELMLSAGETRTWHP